MRLHRNARTCPHSRLLICERVAGGWSVGAAAEAAGVSARTASKWLARYRAEGRWGWLIGRRGRAGCRVRRLLIVWQRLRRCGGCG